MWESDRVVEVKLKQAEKTPHTYDLYLECIKLVISSMALMRDERHHGCHRNVPLKPHKSKVGRPHKSKLNGYGGVRRGPEEADRRYHGN